MDIPRLERLTVKVHLLGEPCLWCWEIVDVEDDALVESSWATEWRSSEPAPSARPPNETMLGGWIAAEATAALGSMSTGTSGGVNGRGCLALAFLRHDRRPSRERPDLSKPSYRRSTRRL